MVMTGSVCVLCVMIFQQQRKERSKENAALFDAAADVEWLRRTATELHYFVHAIVEGLRHAL